MRHRGQRPPKNHLKIAARISNKRVIPRMLSVLEVGEFAAREGKR
jgi:hypothetical protein